MGSIKGLGCHGITHVHEHEHEYEYKYIYAIDTLGSLTYCINISESLADDWDRSNELERCKENLIPILMFPKNVVLPQKESYNWKMSSHDRRHDAYDITKTQYL